MPNTNLKQGLDVGGAAQQLGRRARTSSSRCYVPLLPAAVPHPPPHLLRWLSTHFSTLPLHFHRRGTLCPLCSHMRHDESRQHHFSPHHHSGL